MDDGDPKSIEGDGIVRLQITEHSQPSEQWSSSAIFEPRREGVKREKAGTGNAKSGCKKGPTVPAPEKKLTLFALRLAVLEKMATGLGTLGFIWATVVLLGGFAIALSRTDFWFITTILLIEGARIFSRSHELEWQHQATWSLADAGFNSFRALKSSSRYFLRTVKAIFRPFSTIRLQNHRDRELTQSTHVKNLNDRIHRTPTRIWVTSDVPLLPYARWVFQSRNISKVLYWFQLLSALACSTLSLMKLVRQNFGEISKTDPDKRNLKPALDIFYGLAFSEAALFLLEKAYWEWKVSFYKLLEEVNNECDFEPSGVISIRRFFYDSYSKCINGSIFDGLKMDLVSFGMELLSSDSGDEQLIGSRILRKFVMNERFSDDTLLKIGISISVIERLVEILNWKDPQEHEIRHSAAEILTKLAGKKQNSLRVAGIPGAMESISSLLYNSRSSSSEADEISQKDVILDQENYEFSTFNQLGLLILKKLSRDHDNCGKIGNTRGLLSKVIDFTQAGARLLRDESVTQSQIMTVKRSLQLVKKLATTTGNTGKILRQEISEIVFTTSNIREILRHGGNYPMLQKLGIEILTGLALEADATERIGSTGGILKELFRIFFKKGMPESHNHVRVAAGQALAMLAFESERNCDRILKLDMVAKLVTALEDPVLCRNSARILRNLCVYAEPGCFFQLKAASAAAPIVLRAIMSEADKLQEVMLGLASQVFKFMTSQESSIIFEQAGITETELATKLVQIMRSYRYPAIKVPRIRRFTIELVIWMMKDKVKHIHIFKSLGMEKELQSVTETTSELESFNVFSGTIGLSRHSITIHSLVDTALELLVNG